MDGEGEGSVGGSFWITILRGLLRVIGQRDLVMFLLRVSFCFWVTVEEALGWHWLEAWDKFLVWTSSRYGVRLVVGARRLYAVRNVLS